MASPLFVATLNRVHGLKIVPLLWLVMVICVPSGFAQNQSSVTEARIIDLVTWTTDIVSTLQTAVENLDAINEVMASREGARALLPLNHLGSLQRTMISEIVSLANYLNLFRFVTDPAQINRARDYLSTTGRQITDNVSGYKKQIELLLDDPEYPLISPYLGSSLSVLEWTIERLDVYAWIMIEFHYY